MTIKKTTMTHTMLWEKGCRGEMLRLYFKLWSKCRPTDSLLQQYDYDITRNTCMQ